MARLNVTSPEIKQLVREKLATLYLAAGNIAGMARLLNATDVVRSSGAVLHANRLHSLLSDDVTQSVNERTAALAGAAAEEILKGDRQLLGVAEAELGRLSERAADSKLFNDASSVELAAALDVPRAIALVIWDRLQPKTNESPVQAARALGGKPDWSYQDAAVSRCLDALRRRPQGRIGLVLPTGAGKTRTALKIILAIFKQADPDALVVWVTHRQSLKDQALRELQKVLADAPESGEDLNRFANRVRVMMLTEARALLRSLAPKLALVVIDEAHHAAAPTYLAMLEEVPAVPVLMLTATPNRTDQLPIGVDEIAYTITFRELAERGAIIIPTFEDFPVDDFSWKPSQIEQLAAHVLRESKDRFTKTLVIAPRIERIHEFYNALVAGLEADHPIQREDVGFIHSDGNSLRIPNAEFLSIFSAKSRGILVSAQMLLEGYDDPAINAVVITYPSSSVVVLMQAAGRGVRYAPGKKSAYVLQARNDSLEYHFDQRWLYQEISDFLRPQLIDIEYHSVADLREKVAAVLVDHRVEPSAARRIMNELEAQLPGDLLNLFLFGFPFFGLREEFESKSNWGAVLETPGSSARLRAVFNGFCEMGASVSDPSDYLTSLAAHGIAKDLAEGSPWRQLTSLLIASHFAKKEVYGTAEDSPPGTRPLRNNGATTWLKYVTFKYRPRIPALLASFLGDCHNQPTLEEQYLTDPEAWMVAVKVPLPLGGSEGFLLSPTSAHALHSMLEILRLELVSCTPSQQVGVLASFIANSAVNLPNRLLFRLEFLLSTQRAVDQFLNLRQPIF
jgi:superfamily II DNA or RNA helicase